MQFKAVENDKDAASGHMEHRCLRRHLQHYFSRGALHSSAEDTKPFQDKD